MNEYNLINSRAIADYCRKIKHKFNTEELAVLIYRSKNMSIGEKTKAYNELIEKYPDMPMIKHLHCGPYDSIKDCIRIEIERLENVYNKLKIFDEDSVYQWEAYYISSGRFYNNSRVYRKYEDVIEEITAEIEEDNDISEFRIIKKSLNNEYEVTAEFYVNNKIVKNVYLYDSDIPNPAIGTIFINIPTPFKKGDLLYSNSNTPFGTGCIPNRNNVFCLNWMITWEEKIEERSAEGWYDDSDMMGDSYYIYEGDLIEGHCYEYDSWEFYEGQLTGMERILKGVKNLLQGKIELDLFLQAYNIMRKESMYNNLHMFTYEGCELAGFNEEDIKKFKLKYNYEIKKIEEC